MNPSRTGSLTRSEADQATKMAGDQVQESRMILMEQQLASLHASIQLLVDGGADMTRRRAFVSPEVTFKMEPGSTSVVDLKSVLVERKTAFDQALDAHVESMPYKMMNVMERMFQRLSVIGGSTNDCLKFALLGQSFSIPDWRCIEAALDNGDVQTIRNLMILVQPQSFPRCRRGGFGGGGTFGSSIQYRGGRGRGGGNSDMTAE
eukprot:Lankesteria_metandrocarpae@DN1338_c0_g1_i1.p1